MLDEVSIKMLEYLTRVGTQTPKFTPQLWGIANKLFVLKLWKTTQVYDIVVTPRYGDNLN